MTCHHSLILGTCDDNDCPGPDEINDPIDDMTELDEPLGNVHGRYGTA